MSTAPRSFRKDHVPELDGLRGIAVLLVIWVHLPVGALGETVKAIRAVVLPGDFGVDLFFVLSGFLITRILLVDCGNKVPLRFFVMRRFLRIFPIYYLAILILLPHMNWQQVLTCATYTSNFGFMAMDEHGPLAHSWSLAIEEHYYLLWPPIVAFLSPRASRRVILFGVFPLAIGSLLWAYSGPAWGERTQAMKEFVFRSSTIRFASLGLGGLLAYGEQRIRDSRALALGLIAAGTAMWWVFSLRGMARLGFIDDLLAIPAVDGDLNAVNMGLSVIGFPCLSLALVVSGIAWSNSRAPHTVLLRAAPLRAVGRISYGLYIYHVPIFHVGGVWGSDPFALPTPARVAIVIGLTFLVSSISYRFIERPLLAVGRRFRPGADGAAADEAELRWRPVPIATGLAAAGAIAWLLLGGSNVVANGAADLVERPDRSAAAADARAREAAPAITDRLESIVARARDGVPGLEAVEVAFHEGGVERDGWERTRAGSFHDPLSGAVHLDVAMFRTVERFVRQEPRLLEELMVALALSEATDPAASGEARDRAAAELMVALGQVDGGGADPDALRRRMEFVYGKLEALEENLGHHLPGGWERGTLGSGRAAETRAAAFVAGATP